MSDLDLDADLDDFLGTPVPMQATEDGAPEVVLPAPDEAVADKLLFRARRLAEEGKRIQDHAQARIDEIRAWEADRLAGIRADAERVRRSLEGFTRAYIAANPKRKSIALSNGTLKLTAPGRGRVEVDNEYALIAWCEENGRPDLLRYKAEPNKAGLVELHQSPGPVRMVEDEEYETWHLMATVDTDGARELVSIPGVVFMRRRADRFDMKAGTDTPTEQNRDTPKHEESEE